MALKPNYRLAELALDSIEQVEARGLVWGLVDNALSDAEVTDCLRSVLASPEAQGILGHPDCTIGTASDLSEFLVNQRQLFVIPKTHEETKQWRSRMAEGVRLLARLRQLFPRHTGHSGWASAPTLVADFRFLWRPRRYPLRDQSREDAIAALQSAVADPNLLAPVRHWLQSLPTDARLAKFQVDATARILSSLSNGTCRGTLVSAGTGSGKTLAFYLPALSWLAQQRKTSPNSRGVRALALYPRNELLKDQLSEVYSQCRKFDDWLTRSGSRPLRVGVLYGETPSTPESTFYPYSNWIGDHRERVCPFFRCPQEDCGGEMVLRKSDLVQDSVRLTCRLCGTHVDEQSLVFTRKDLESDPPDVLFTSVEMLNQNLSNSQIRHLFGVGARATKAPDLVLLDEVHLYAGTYGAQVGYLLRRWWALSGRRSNFVGLSATITDGRAFFANLTGLEESAVEVISPNDSEMTEEGAEYLLALRGDPVSQTALLSTSIQSLMLLSRLLDPRDNFDFKSMPFNGWRSFAFTDQLDATNRLYKNLLDAEGRYPNGNRNTTRYPQGGLAALRQPMEPPGQRYIAGQDWRIVIESGGIGHDLSACLEVGRTTSLDTGVSTRSQIVIATAALEVGFDDPAVGVVLQHKAPRDTAQFLQRKGRSGRTRHMRPWTVVVLSDYGRDRLAYQAYDQLFDPVLPARQLPMTNRYVQRMQAVYALIDELGQRTQNEPIPGSVWRDLRGPLPDATPEGWTDIQFSAVRRLVDGVTFPLTRVQWSQLRKQALQCAPSSRVNEWSGVNWLQAKLRRARLLNILANILQDSNTTELWSTRLGQLLGLPRDEMEPLLWSQPRPVLLGAVPTALRRLGTNWRSHQSADGDHQAGHPLPDFVPANLFSDLSLPEMRIEVPSDGTHTSAKFMPVQQGLTEFAPGRVSMRFDTPIWLGIDGQTLMDILNLQADVVDRDAQLSNWYELDHHGKFYRRENGIPVAFRAFRPISAKPQQTNPRTNGVRSSPQFKIADTSNAQLVWSTQLLAPRVGTRLQSPTNIGIAKIIPSATIHTHASQSEALARRYAIGSKAELRITKGKENQRVTVQWRFLDGDHPCGVGFELATDALVFDLNLPTSLHQDIDWTDPTRLRAARSARYSWEAQHGEDLSALVPNIFLRSWLAQIFQTAALLICRTTSCALRTALDELATGNHLDVLLDVLKTVFQATISDEEDQVQEGSDRLRQALNEQLSDPSVRLALRSVAKVLVDPLDSSWDVWLSMTIRTTLGAAILEAIQQAAPQVEGDALLVDIDPGLYEDGAPRDRQQIWVSESNPGGNGLIEQVVDILITQPDKLYRHIEAALGPQEFEVTDRQLRDTVQRLGGVSTDQDLIDAFARVRHAQSSVEAQVQFGQLRAELVMRGQAVFHGYAVALSLRLLRQESPEELDILLAEVQSKWDELEEEHGIEVDVRLVCALYSNDVRLDQAFAGSQFDLPDGDRRSWRFSVLLGILWARGHALRSTVLPLPYRYAGKSYASERLLIGQWLTPREEPIDPRNDGWATLLRERLVANSRATVSIPASDAPVWLPSVVREVVTEPVQFEYLNIYARLHSIKRMGEHVEWTFEIPEAA